MTLERQEVHMATYIIEVEPAIEYEKLVKTVLSYDERFPKPFHYIHTNYYQHR